MDAGRFSSVSAGLLVQGACGHWRRGSSSRAGMLLLSACPVTGCFQLQVNTSIDDWKTTRWKDINVEQMDVDCKKFSKDIRSLDKEMRSWDAFTGLDSSMKNMITSLRAVNELQNPAIRDRHWHELMQATKVCPAPLSLLPSRPDPRGWEGPQLCSPWGKHAGCIRGDCAQMFVQAL